MQEKAQKKYAGFWRRFISMSIDALILFPSLYVLLIVLQLVPNATVQVIISQSVWFLYFVGFESSSWHATPGRRVMSVYLVSETGGTVSFAQAAARYIIWALPSIPYTIFTMSPSYQKFVELITAAQTKMPITQEHVDVMQLNQFLSFGGLAGMLILVVLPIVFTKQKTAVHDLLMKTRVVKGKFPNTIAGEKE